MTIDSVSRPREPSPDWKSAAQKVLEGFERGVFVRDTSGDSSSGWALRLVAYLTALHDLQAAVDFGALDAGRVPETVLQRLRRWRNPLVLSIHDEWHHTKPAQRKDIVRFAVERAERFYVAAQETPKQGGSFVDFPHADPKDTETEGYHRGFTKVSQ